jgi:hypothetical protein
MHTFFAYKRILSVLPPNLYLVSFSGIYLHLDDFMVMVYVGKSAADCGLCVHIEHIITRSVL